MSYLFRSETINYNAFYAVKDITDFLTSEDLGTFRKILCDTIESNIANQPCNVIFDSGYTFPEDNRFTFIDDKHMIYYGTEPLDQIIGSINSCLDKQLQDIFSKTRDDFAERISNKLHKEQREGNFKLDLRLNESVTA